MMAKPIQPRWTSVCLFLILALIVAKAEGQVADLVISNVTIATMDDAIPMAEALAIKDGRILAVGSGDSIKKTIGPHTRHFKLNGEFVMPGFIEGHAHFLGLGESLMMLKLADARRWSEIVEQVEVAASNKKPGEWILGRGWHQSKWETVPQPNTDGYPTADALSLVSPNNPVLLTHASGHMAIANEYAMRLAGVDAESRDPAGGEILRDDLGKPTGVFRETAEDLIVKAMNLEIQRQSPSARQAYWDQAIKLASAECLRFGITSFQDAGTSYENLKWLKQAAIDQRLGVRLWVMIRDDNKRHKAFLKNRSLLDLQMAFTPSGLSKGPSTEPSDRMVHGCWPPIRICQLVPV